MSKAKITREEWLTKAVGHIRIYYRKREVILPPTITVAFGFPRAKKAVGQCFLPANHGGTDAWSLFVSPVHKDPVDALDTLCHECAHTAQGTDTKAHGKEFRKVCKQVGLTNGKPSNASASLEMRDWLREMAEKLGPLDHIPIIDAQMVSGGDQPRAPWLKFVSPVNEDVRVQMGPKAWAACKKPPLCPLSRKPMVCEGGLPEDDDESDDE